MNRLRSVMVAASLAAAVSSPALAGCLGHPEENFCFTANVEIAHNAATLFNIPVRASGNIPQSVATPRLPQAYASASSSAAHNGTLSLHTEVNDDDYYLAYAEAGLSYTFQVASKDSSAPSDPFVSFNVQAIAFTLRDQFQFEGTASFELDQDGKRILYAEQADLDDPKAMIMFSVNQWIDVKPDDDISVKMFATSSVSSYPGYGRYSSGVLLDPVYTIAPEYASRYTLVGLPEGSTSTGAVPEPASWAMMIGGFGMLGGAMRRRRSVAIRFA